MISKVGSSASFLGMVERSRGAVRKKVSSQKVAIAHLNHNIDHNIYHTPIVPDIYLVFTLQCILIYIIIIGNLTCNSSTKKI